MKKIIAIISEELMQAFEAKGYDPQYGIVTLSNRPDLCQYQCNGALSAAKAYKKAPIMIANEIVEVLKESKTFEKIEAIMPGFINISLNSEFLADYLNEMTRAEQFGLEKTGNPKTIVIDYGGPNVAKPLHVGHLRSAVIGESIKRICRYAGHNVIGDVHLGDWGLQMGLIITELKKRKPDLVYFDESYTGEYPEEAPFTISELEEIYPAANEYSKTHPEYKEEAKNATFLLQNGNRGYMALWNHILNVSVTDLKKNYEKLNVSFDLWKKESDAQPYIPDMIQYLKENNYTRISEGALVVDVKEETDTKEIPPCMILKSDGATLYNTTDLATMVERMKLFQPDAITYIVDKRQELYFEQVFRCAKKTKLVDENVKLTFLGFGTMNGKDGKPFKTRDGGVMRLENLINEINDAVFKKMMENREMPEEEAKSISKKVGLAALKYGDLSNQASKDYVFDIDRFISFEGDTGPYILYTIVRIKSIVAKYKESTGKIEITENTILPTNIKSEITLMLQASKFNDVIINAYEDNAPHRICQYIYELANAFNSFYHENKIIAEENKEKQQSWIGLIILIQEILETCIELLGFEAPDRM
ncbi:MAG: arginine--tRNA ligase [Anaerocolumna aminovalerica]|uniref:arginine--tRNA ligase n=1 Tax=Anaerocolumna aminovalerica TaxID=1527 RepID=UPI001C0EB024|nr:arginine--tRNA ligase [Anaerocolumna aminovalerica]MBU5331212.1 arginine--tRNA ligase [Anaerocolumna aminovalerica]MDU6264303.1 arginine--tRNA ligase [Anaerocolumna aminovalerica]